MAGKRDDGEAAELLACPFCGSPAELIDCEERPNKGAKAIECTGCRASSRVHFPTKEDAVPHVIDAWNTRVDVATAVLDLQTKLACARIAAKDFKAQRDALLHALRKFSDAHEKTADPISDSDLDDEQSRCICVTLGDFRRARRLITRLV